MELQGFPEYVGTGVPVYLRWDRGQATADQAWQVTSFIYFYVFIYLAALRLSRSMWELHCVMWASCGLLFNCGMRAPELVGPSTGKDLP